MASNVAFIPGYVLSPSDLNIFITNSNGQRQDPYEISYAIFDNTTGIERLIGSDSREPGHPEVGEYYANFQIPENAPFGDYVVRWKFKQITSSPYVFVAQEFAVVPEGTQTGVSSPYTEKERSLLRSLRIMLRDANPDRNYRFAPPSSQSALNQQTRVFGYIWEDEELIEAVRLGLHRINLYPPQSFWTLSSLPDNWTYLLLTAAAVIAIQALSLNWVAEEFSYSIGGVSLDLEKSSKYQGMASDFQSSLESMMEPAHNTLKYVKGLRQSRFSPGMFGARGWGPHTQGTIMSPANFTRW